MTLAKLLGIHEDERTFQKPKSEWVKNCFTERKFTADTLKLLQKAGYEITGYRRAQSGFGEKVIMFTRKEK